MLRARLLTDSTKPRADTEGFAKVKTDVVVVQWRAIHTQGQGVNGKRIVIKGRFPTFEPIFLSEEDFSCIKSVHQSLLAAGADQLIVHI